MPSLKHQGWRQGLKDLRVLWLRAANGRAVRGQEESARAGGAALEAGERRAELEALLASNLHRRRDELAQALAEADVGAARRARAASTLLFAALTGQQPALPAHAYTWHDVAQRAALWGRAARRQRQGSVCALARPRQGLDPETLNHSSQGGAGRAQRGGGGGSRAFVRCRSPRGWGRTLHSKTLNPLT